MRNPLLAVTLAVAVLVSCSKTPPEPSAGPHSAPASAPAPAAPIAPDTTPPAELDSAPATPDASPAEPPRALPAFTPPRPLPEQLAPLGERCASGDGPACEELAIALDKRGLLFAFIAPWVERGCDLGHRPSCERLVDQARALIERRGAVVIDLSTLVLPDAPAQLEALCELGYWQACAHLATTFGLEACPLAKTYDEADAFPPDETRASSALTRARPLAEKACDDKDPEACGWLAAMFADDCGHGYDRDKAEAFFLRHLEYSGLTTRCEADELPACRSLASHCSHFRQALRAEDAKPAASGEIARLVIDWADSSSTLPPWKGYRFDADQLKDGSLNTSWQPLDKRRGGVGQKVTLGFSGPRRVSAITIANGFQREDKLGDLFVLNNRARNIRLTFSDGSQLRFELAKDARGSTRFDFKPRLITQVELEVLSIWRGEKWNDLAISEIEILGEQDIAAESGPRLPAACEVPATVAKRRCDADDWAFCQELGTFRNHSDPSAETLVVSVGERLCAERSDAGVCLATARHLARRNADRAHASKLAARACTLGSSDACGEVGCHGEVVGGTSASGDFDLAPALCKAACQAGDTFSCFALAEAAHPGVLDNYDHPANKKLRAGLSACSSVAACLGAAELARGADTYRFGMPESVLEVVGALELGCELGSAQACAELSFEASLSKLGKRAAKKACELDPEDCGQADISTPETELGELVLRCGRHEVEACGHVCVALDQSSEGARLFERHARPELGMTPAFIELLCSEATLFDPCSCGCC